MARPGTLTCIRMSPECAAAPAACWRRCGVTAVSTFIVTCVPSSCSLRELLLAMSRCEVLGRASPGRGRLEIPGYLFICKSSLLRINQRYHRTAHGLGFFCESSLLRKPPQFFFCESGLSENEPTVPAFFCESISSMSIFCLKRKYEMHTLGFWGAPPRPRPGAPRARPPQSAPPRARALRSAHSPSLAALALAALPVGVAAPEARPYIRFMIYGTGPPQSAQCRKYTDYHRHQTALACYRHTQKLKQGRRPCHAATHTGAILAEDVELKERPPQDSCARRSSWSLAPSCPKQGRRPPPC